MNIILQEKYKSRFERWGAEKTFAILMALYEYEESGSYTLPDEYLDAFEPIKDDIDAMREAYNKRCQQNAENGKKGGRPKKQTDFEETEKTERFSEKPKETEKTHKIKENKIKENKEYIKDNRQADIDEVISFLNTQTGKKFKNTSKMTRAVINARLNDGYTVQDCRQVISIKTSQWKGDEKMDRFLCPDTLFRPSNFEKYLNERPIKPKGAYIQRDAKTEAFGLDYLKEVQV